MKTSAQIVDAARTRIPTCTPAEAATRLSADDSVNVIDVREAMEYDEARIAGSINIPRGLLEWKIASVCSDPTTPILVHCASGGRAILAANTLIEMGYKNVTAIDSSFADLAACLPTGDSATGT